MLLRNLSHKPSSLNWEVTEIFSLKSTTATSGTPSTPFRLGDCLELTYTQARLFEKLFTWAFRID